MNIHGLLGILNIKQYIFVAIICERRWIGKLFEAANIYEVTVVNLVPLNCTLNSLQGDESILNLKNGVEKYLSTQGFYYSHHCDLSLS